MDVRGGQDVALIGRSSELAVLNARVGALTGGTGGLALVSGEAGSGKTRLVEELLAGLKAPVLRATATVFDYARAPYAPIRDLLAALDARLPKVLAKDDALRAALEPVRSLGDVAAGTDPQSARRRALDGVVEAVGKYAASAPLVLAVEDVQWIDQASADVLSHLAAHAETTRVLLLATYRTNDEAETEAGRDMVARFARRMRGGQVALRALADLDARALVDAAASADLDNATRRSICELADGNPLLLLELTGHASESPRDSAGELPISLQALVDERIAAFARDDRRTLQVAALLGEFDAQMLAEIAGIDREAVFVLLRDALKKRVLVESAPPLATYSFRHALIRRAVTEQLLAAERTEMHGRIARATEARAGASATVAHHYELAGDAARARAAFVRAGDEAYAAFAFADSCEAYRRAIGVGAIDDEALAIGWKFVASSDLTQRRAEHMPTFESLRAFAASTGRIADAAALELEISRLYFNLGEDPAAVASAEAAFAAVEHDDASPTAFEAATLVAWNLVHLRRLDEAAAWLARAARRIGVGTPRSLCWYHETRAGMDVHSGTRATWRDDYAEILRIAESQPPDMLIRRLVSASALALASNLEDFDYARKALRRAESVASEHGLTTLAQVLVNVANIEYTLGGLEEARQAVSRGLVLAGDDPLQIMLLVRTGIPLALRLRDDELMRRCGNERVLDLAYQAVSSVVYGPVAASFAEKLVADGRRAAAITLVEKTIARLPDGGNNVALLVAAARWNVSASKPAARALLEALAPTSRSGAAALALFDAYGSTGEERRKRATAAAEGFARLGWRLWEAEARELAGERDAARAIYAACGSVADLVRFDEAADAKAIPGGLSRREWDVAQLVAQGKSNRAIAQALVLSERTVENHIASIFNKRSLRSRSEIAGFVAREERLPLAK